MEEPQETETYLTSFQFSITLTLPLLTTSFFFLLANNWGKPAHVNRALRSFRATEIIEVHVLLKRKFVA